jgi:hypothetical protein
MDWQAGTYERLQPLPTGVGNLWTVLEMAFVRQLIASVFNEASTASTADSESDLTACPSQ